MDKIRRERKHKTKCCKRPKELSDRPHPAQKTNWAIVLSQRWARAWRKLPHTHTYIFIYILSVVTWVPLKFCKNVAAFPPLPQQLRLFRLINMPGKCLVKLQLSLCLPRNPGAEDRWIIIMGDLGGTVLDHHHRCFYNRYLFGLSAKISTFRFALLFVSCVFVNKKLAQNC